MENSANRDMLFASGSILTLPIPGYIFSIQTCHDLIIKPGTDLTADQRYNHHEHADTNVTLPTSGTLATTTQVDAKADGAASSAERGSAVRFNDRKSSSNLR
jgi:hypothetical protein